VNKGKSKDQSVESPILPPPTRCAPFSEDAPLPVDVLCKESHHAEFTYLRPLITTIRYRLSVALSGVIVYSRPLIL
jgi:hypothetical protein